MYLAYNDKHENAYDNGMECRFATGKGLYDPQQKLFFHYVVN